LRATWRFGPTPAERFWAWDDPAAWPAGILDWNTSPVDLSFLNAAEKPAGKRGFLKVERDQLVFEDGTVAALLGNELDLLRAVRNLEGERQAAGAAASELGFQPGADPPPRLALGQSKYLRRPEIPGHAEPELAMLEKLDWWIKCLKDEGNLRLARSACREKSQKAGDRIYGFEEIKQGQTSGRAQGLTTTSTRASSRR